MKSNFPFNWWPGLTTVFLLALMLLGTQWDTSPLESPDKEVVAADSLQAVLESLLDALDRPSMPEGKEISGKWQCVKGLSTEQLHQFEREKL